MNAPESARRTVFYVSDRTGVTAEMLGHSILAQFEHVEFEAHALPFVETAEKAHALRTRITQVAAEGVRPIVFSTLVNPEVRAIVASAPALFLDCFQIFVAPLEEELGTRSQHAIGRSRLRAGSEDYYQRMEVINFTVGHDDGIGSRDLAAADVILIGVSRCGKTPTSLYLALQFGVRAANFPLIPEDLERGVLPERLEPHRAKLHGLTISPSRLHQIRTVRRPGSAYASLPSCIREVNEAERIMRASGISIMDTTSRSIEELASAIVVEAGLERRLY